MLEFLKSLLSDASKYEEGYFGGAEGALRFLVLVVFIVLSLTVWNLVKV